MIFLSTGMYSLRTDPTRLEYFIRELIPKKLTGLLKVTFDACDGVILLDKGIVIDGYEIFNDELLVKDRNGRHIVERHKAEPGTVALYEVQPETLQAFLKMLQEDPPENFQTLLDWFCNERRKNLLN